MCSTCPAGDLRQRALAREIRALRRDRAPTPLPGAPRRRGGRLTRSPRERPAASTAPRSGRPTPLCRSSHRTRHPLGARSPRARSRPQRTGPQSPAPARPRNGWQPIGQSGHHRTARPCSTMTPSVPHAGRKRGRSLSCPCSGGSITGARGASVVLQGADGDSGPVVDPLRCAQRPREGEGWSSVRAPAADGYGLAGWSASEAGPRAVAGAGSHVCSPVTWLPLVP